MHECPICDSPHDTQHGVAVHMVNKQGEEHDAVGDLETAYTRIYADSDGGPQQATPDGGTEPDTNDTDSGSTVDTPEFPEADREGVDDSEPDVLECPGCESSDVIESDTCLEEHRGKLGREHIALIERSDYVCTECGGVFDAE